MHSHGYANAIQFAGMDPDKAAQLYLERINIKIPVFETMDEKDLNYVKMINAGQRIELNNVSFGYISHRIVFYLMNLHIKTRQVFFARAGTSEQYDSFKSDASLGKAGVDYSKKMADTLIAHKEEERLLLIETLKAQGEIVDIPAKPLTVWTSTRKRTVETAQYLADLGYPVRQRSQMSQLNPGICEKMSERRIRQDFPEEVEKHELDPYHHRYPRAESYHDLAVRLEPVILELEREKNDLLIIAHESVLRVLYGYLMACDAMSIPTLSFPRNEIIEVSLWSPRLVCLANSSSMTDKSQIIPASYQNEAKRIPILGLAPDIVPSSPQDLKIPVVPSGVVTPLDGLGTPIMNGRGTPVARDT